MRAPHVFQRCEHAFTHLWRALLDIVEHLLDLLTPKILLGAAEVARDDGEIQQHGVCDDVTLRRIKQRSDDRISGMTSVTIR